uniref:Reverse transcriptase domain-containing protein n=1 Tax=Rhabditophanes sp. KR3021 TaxID=114890 RepID=A0AC35TYY6_9BILA
MLLDKAYTQDARFQRKKHLSAWYDFKKAYDSISHKQIARLIDVLNLNSVVKSMIKGMMCKWNIELIRKDYATPKNIPVKQRVYQGDSWSPLIFILVTAGIMTKLEMNFYLK